MYDLLPIVVVQCIDIYADVEAKKLSKCYLSGTPCIYDPVHGIKKNFRSVIWVEKGCCGAKIGTIKNKIGRSS